MTFMFWEAKEFNGAPMYLLTPGPTSERAKDTWGATLRWTVEANSIQDAQARLIEHMGWGPIIPRVDPLDTDSN
jgi:hypothetical protein